MYIVYIKPNIDKLIQEILSRNRQINRFLLLKLLLKNVIKIKLIEKEK